jgi:hypothetical protein
MDVCCVLLLLLLMHGLIVGAGHCGLGELGAGLLVVAVLFGVASRTVAHLFSALGVLQASTEGKLLLLEQLVVLHPDHGRRVFGVLRGLATELLLLVLLWC